MNFGLGDQEQVQHAKAFILLVNHDGSARRRPRQELAMVNPERPAITHIDGEGSERESTMNIFELFNCHGRIIPERGSAFTGASHGFSPARVKREAQWGW